MSVGLRKNHVLAGLVAIVGVIVIWAVGAARQEDETDTFARRWVGQQWDIARNCLVGTPVGRSEDAGAIRTKLDRMLVDTIVRASEHDAAPDVSTLWPARCASIFPSLRADRRLLRADPADAVAMLEVLAPRVLRSDRAGALALDAAQSRARAHELAEPIALLDRAMPSGAAYARALYERPEVGVAASAVLDSLECEPRAPQSTADETSIAGEVCRAGEVVHIVAAHDGRSTWIVSRDQAGAAVDIDPPPPQHASVVACSENVLVIAWREGDAWGGTICEGERCAAMPVLRTDGDLEIAVGPELILAVARGRRTDVPMARTFEHERGSWSEPVAVARGTLSVDGSAFRIDACTGGAFRSSDGRTWVAVDS